MLRDTFKFLQEDVSRLVPAKKLVLSSYSNFAEITIYTTYNGVRNTRSNIDQPCKIIQAKERLQIYTMNDNNNNNNNTFIRLVLN